MLLLYLQIQLMCFNVFYIKRNCLVLLTQNYYYKMTYYIYKRNRAGAAFQLGWSFNKDDLAAKLKKYAFWKQNGYSVFYIETN